jgi:hypothetical protein
MEVVAGACECTGAALGAARRRATAPLIQSVVVKLTSLGGRSYVVPHPKAAGCSQPIGAQGFGIGRACMRKRQKAFYLQLQSNHLL